MHLAKFATELTFPRGRMVELDASTRVYFIREGSCSLLYENPSPPAQDTKGDARVTKPPPLLELGSLEKGSVFGAEGIFRELQQRWQCR
jgi:hypothetical protein